MDMSVLNIKEREFTVLATCGDMHLGGQDIDNIMLRHCLSTFKKKTG